MSSKCPNCGKTVYFAERSSWEGKDYHAQCLIAVKNKEGGIHNKGWYGTTPGDPVIVSQLMQGQNADPNGPYCSSCGKRNVVGAKFCSGCGKPL